MNYILTRLLFPFYILLPLAGFISSCANIASPNGGPYDENPPKFLSSTPRIYETNYTGKKITLLFDELIQLEKPSENVIITPPQKTLPSIRTAGKKVQIELQDSIIENMTYTVDFTNSIVDNNEKNVLENFSFAFSSGDVVDSLEISGTLLQASNLEPMQGILVGLHQHLEDSAFTSTAFFRTSKTNDRGRFTIRNIAPGSYRLYALEDQNRDYFFDQPGEAIAFYDSVIVPTFEPSIRQDTVWKDSLTVDTVRMVEYNRFLPDDIVMHLFREDFQRQYMLRPERPQDRLFALRFNAPVTELPDVRLLNRENFQNWYYIQMLDGKTTLNYWITDSLTWITDTLQLQVNYLKSDSLNILRPQTDTVRLVHRKQPERKEKSKKEEPDTTVKFLNMEVSVSSEVFDTLYITFSEPVHQLSKETFVLEQQQDTLWHPVDFTFRQDSLNTLKYCIERTWRYSESYRLLADSAVIHSIYGQWNDWCKTPFRFNSRDKYGHLYLNIQNFSLPAFVELLDGNDNPVRKAPVKEGGALFMNLNPGKYYARLISDANENGIWDTGNYGEKKQPEAVFYSTKVYDISANWEIEEDWDMLSVPAVKQKPLEITKNKPKDDTKKKRDHREDSRQSGNRPGLGGAGNFGL
ncbi:MAG: Ig-like domain-containing protein [Tannerella sp.]|jgi:uncharacterized protein (DUF2141 family)|nr:Ig-like domain-containing protein [Tannerella sp.]